MLNVVILDIDFAALFLILFILLHAGREASCWTCGRIG